MRKLHFNCMTPLTRERVNDPSLLSRDGKNSHYMNRNEPRRRQGEGRDGYHAIGRRAKQHTGQTGD